MVKTIIASVIILATTSYSINLRDGAGVQMYDGSGRSHQFQSRKAAMNAGMLMGHFPDVDSCHSACEAAKGCGHDQECLCNCCDVGAMENDGCFCFSCGPIGKPITFWSEHANVNPRSNPLDSSEEPNECMYSKRRRSNVAVIIVRKVFISAFLFYCLLLNYSFPTNPNSVTNCFKLILFYLQLYKLHLLNAFVYF